jgi:hypothetical protein
LHGDKSAPAQIDHRRTGKGNVFSEPTPAAPLGFQSGSVSNPEHRALAEVQHPSARRLPAEGRYRISGYTLQQPNAFSIPLLRWLRQLHPRESLPHQLSGKLPELPCSVQAEEAFGVRDNRQQLPLLNGNVEDARRFPVESRSRDERVLQESLAPPFQIRHSVPGGAWQQ